MSFDSLVTKYVDGFPFSNLALSRDGRKLFYLWQKEGGGLLHVLSTDSPSRLTEGRQLSDVDFTEGSFGIHGFDEERGMLYLLRDDAHRENYNLWRLDLSSGELRRLTDFPCLRGFFPDRHFRRAWCRSQRRLSDGTFQSEIHQIDLSTLETRLVVSDDGWIDRIGWGGIQESADGENLYFGADFLNRRLRTNIWSLDLRTGERRKLLPPWLEEAGNPHLVDERPHLGKLLFQSVHEGFENIYELDIAKGDWRRITDLQQKSEMLDVHDRPDGKCMFAVLEEGESFVLRRYRLDGSYQSRSLAGPGVVDRTDRDLWVHLTASDTVKSLVRFDDDMTTQAGRWPLTTEEPAALEHTRTESLTYRTFDGLKVSALLHRPKGPLRAALVIAFYGGSSVYSSMVQMFAELGIAVLSPAVRGSWGCGRSWEKKLEGDLGGDEILDVIWGARWLSKELGLPPAKVGVWGSSHGGYATLRAVTLPPDFRGLDARFEFGFAVAEAGFADLEAFHRDSQIADWLVHLLGPLDPAKYQERSPVHHLENLACPLLVINGTNDARVPFSTIRGFIDRLRKSGKAHRILIHEGQGHHAGTRATKLDDRRAVVEFLHDFVLNPKA